MIARSTQFKQNQKRLKSIDSRKPISPTPLINIAGVFYGERRY